MEEWYFTKGDQQEGPVSPQQLRALVLGGHLDPASTHVWREGMEGWQFIKDSGLLDEPPAPSSKLPAPNIAPVTANKPYVATTPSYEYQAPVRKSYEVEAQYPGYGRLSYFLINLVMTVVFYVVIFLVLFTMFGIGAGMGAFGMVLVVAMGMAVVGLYIAYQRVINLGMSGWSLLWAIVPFMNIWLGWRMMACPPGYEDHRTLDKAAKVISGILIGLIVLGIASAVITVLAIV